MPPMWVIAAATKDLEITAPSPLPTVRSFLQPDGERAGERGVRATPAGFWCGARCGAP